MPCLHNFLVNDTETFLSNPRHLEILYSMCYKVLMSDCGEDPESHAAKLLECIIIQCRGRIDDVMPKILAPALERLTKEIKTSELRQMCLQVVVAGIMYNSNLMMMLLNEVRFPNSSEPIGSDQFVRKWLTHIEDFTGIHDRRICIMGLCSLLSSSAKPPCVLELRNQILPDFIHLFNGLKKAVALREEDGDDEDGDEAEISSGDEELCELGDDEDVIDSDAQDYAEILKLLDVDNDKVDHNCYDMNEELNNADDVDWEGETGLEGYTTVIDDDELPENDEYLIFQNTMMNLEKVDPNLYQGITTALSNEFRTELMLIMQLADQRKSNYKK